MNLRAIKSYNNNYTFILVVIDVLSKYAWVELLREKSCTNIVSAFQRIFSRSNNRIPVILQTDKGKEFVGSKFQNFLKDKGIIFRTARSPDVKAAVAERFNRTLKERLWRYFAQFNTKKYVDVLQDIVKSYNNTQHFSTKMCPSHVNLRNASISSPRKLGA